MLTFPIREEFVLLGNDGLVFDEGRSSADGSVRAVNWRYRPNVMYLLLGPLGTDEASQGVHRITI